MGLFSYPFRPFPSYPLVPVLSCSGFGEKVSGDPRNNISAERMTGKGMEVGWKRMEAE